MILRRCIVLFSSIALALSCYGLVSMPEQNQSALIIGLYSIGFAAYGLLIYQGSKRWVGINLALGLGIAIRFGLVFLFPNLSDDIYRFIWDGRMMHIGMNPLSYTPTELMGHGDIINSYFEDLYPMLNSSEYYTIYPPVSQMVYYLGTATENGWLFSGQVMKAILFLAEVGTGFILVQLLRTLGRSSYWAILYFLNPLVIVEIVGQLHFEGLMIFFFAAGILLLARKQYGWAGCVMALSIGTKLLPLMFLPAVLSYLGERQKIIKFLLGLASCSILIFIPYFWTLDIGHFMQSLNLYFQKFEFNASVYYLLRELGLLLTGYNQIAIIGPLLSLMTLAVILYISLKERIVGLQGLMNVMFWSFAIYLILATTVHPWYLCLLIFLAAFTKQWWVAIWSGVVIWSYTTYASPSFEQNMFVISLEYIVVLIAIGIQHRKVMDKFLGIKKA